MLSTLRGSLNSFFVLLLLGLLISSFAIWGIGDIFTSRSLAVATVGEKEIKAENFMKEFQSRVQSYQAQFGPEFDTQQALSLGVQHMVLGEMISRTTLDEEARIMGLVGAPEKVIEAIHGMDVFKDASGEFSRFNYDQILQGAGLDAQTFENSLLVEHARSQLVETVMAQNPVPNALVDTLYTFRKEKRQANILHIQTSDVASLNEPSETDLSDYYDQHQNYFMYPEYRELEYIVLNPADFAGEIEFSEEELLAAYDERSLQYSTLETRDLNILVLDDEETANNIYARTQAGETLGQVALDVLGYGADDISIGENDYYTIEVDYSEIAAERVFATEQGGVTEPIQTLFGWQMFEVANINPEIIVQFDDVRDEIIEELSAIAGYDAVYDIVEKIEDSIAAGYDMAGVIEETGVDSIVLEPIDRGGLNKEGNLSADAEKILSFLPTGFNALPGDELTVEAFGDGGFYIVEVKNIIEPELKEFASVKNEVQARWYGNQRMRLAAELANQSLLAARGGQSLEELATGFRADVFETSILQRDQSLGNLEISRPVFDLIFSMNEGDVAMEKSSTDDGYLLVQLTLQSPGIPNADDEGYKELAAELSRELANDLIVQYQKAVADNLGVEINEQLVHDLFSPDGVFQNIPGQF